MSEGLLSPKPNTQTHQYLNDSNKEPLLILLVHSPTDGSNGPAQCVEVLPGPFSTIYLVVKLLCHYAFCVRIIQVSQVHCRTVEEMCIRVQYSFC